MFIFFDTIAVSLKTGPDICDITDELIRTVRASGIQNGSLSASMVGSTGSLTTLEFEPGVVEDFKQALQRIAPPDLDYQHEKAWHDGNAHSHIQAAVIGSSVVVPIRKATLRLGTWQQVVAVNHDNRPRKRTVEVTILGTRK